MRIKLLVPLCVSLLCLPISVQAQLASQDWGKPAGAHRIHLKAENLEGLPLGPFAVRPDGKLITVEDSEHSTTALVSSDDGKTWQKIPVFKEPEKFNIRYERALICTREGTVIVAFANMVERANWNWDAKTHDSPDARLPTYIVRSTDAGQTWETPQKLHDDWTGAVRDMVQLSDGTVVFTTMMMRHNPGRHAVVTYASKDQGKTWQRSNVIDLGGIGHHDGAMEATLVERKDNTLWMLLRTNWGKLWQAVSSDGGGYWHPIGPTAIPASTAPPILERLASGRLFLAWNRYFYDGTEEYRKYGGDQQATGTPTSNNRQELSIAFSDDDGITWTSPVVVATVVPEGGKYPLKEVSYPYVFERRPGEIWLTTWRGAGLRVKLFEKDFTGPQAPKMLLQEASGTDPTEASGTRAGLSFMRLPDGSFAFYDRYHPLDGPMTLPDRDGRRHTLLPYLPPEIVKSETIASSGVLSNVQVILAKDNAIKSVYVLNEPIDKETAARVGLPRYLNVWIKQAGLAQLHEPKMIWRGYNGSQMEYQQLPSGRIIVPYGSFQPHGKSVPPTGRHATIVQYSDDDGASWTESESKLVSPCYPGFNGSNEGACEPAIEQLADGRLWMLMRTQAGFLYESFSDDDGATWKSAVASRFNTSTGPPNILRHKNGWLVVTWNNCEMPPRKDGVGVYGGRDALHIAVSADEGKTWRGFREIYLDHRRHDNPARSGDRGTAYPLAAYTEDGKIVVIAGQGAGGRNPIVVDPQWIVQTEASTNFSDGLSDWSVYKHHGPAKAWWQARAVGCELVPNPTDAAAKCLHVRKPDELPADGAVWNFPNGWSGSLTTRVMLPKGSHGASLSLNDRMFDPSNDYGEEFAVFRADIDADGRMGEAVLTPDNWHDVTLQWNLAASECQLLVDGKAAGSLPLRHPTLNGLSYLRFRSTAKEIDPAGLLIGSVSVSITDPYAPPCNEDRQKQHEQRYVDRVTRLWSLGG